MNEKKKRWPVLQRVATGYIIIAIFFGLSVISLPPIYNNITKDGPVWSIVCSDAGEYGYVNDYYQTVKFSNKEEAIKYRDLEKAYVDKLTAKWHICK